MRTPLSPINVEVRPAIDRFADFATIVGPKAGKNGCWCMAYRKSGLDADGRIAYMQEECSRKPGPGVIAYVDGEPAGWCSVAPRSTYRRLMNSRTIPHLSDPDPWSVVCFVVRAGYRRQGLMHHLLNGAIEHARRMGAGTLEGYPADASDGRIDVISGYVGTTRLFEVHGFERAAETTGVSGGKPRWVMRLALQGWPNHSQGNDLPQHDAKQHRESQQSRP